MFVYINIGMRMTGSSTKTAVTFCISPDLKARVDNLARKTNRSSSYFIIN